MIFLIVIQAFEIIKGALPRGFRGFLVYTVLKLVTGNLTHESIIFEHLKEDITSVNLWIEIKPWL